MSPSETARPAPQASLDEDSYRKGVGVLCRIDQDLRSIADTWGVPELRSRKPGFETLLRFILDQHVSLQSGKAVYDRLRSGIGRVTAARFAALSDQKLIDFGFSRQKSRYGRDLATQVLSGSLKLSSLGSLPDDEARARLTAVKGIGRWTADIYLMFVLKRPDTWPVGDRALEVALARLKRLKDRSGKEAFESCAESWRPWRSVAAHLLWHYYRHSPNQR